MAVANIENPGPFAVLPSDTYSSAQGTLDYAGARIDPLVDGGIVRGVGPVAEGLGARRANITKRIGAWVGRSIAIAEFLVKHPDGFGIVASMGMWEKSNAKGEVVGMSTVPTESESAIKTPQESPLAVEVVSNDHALRVVRPEGAMSEESANLTERFMGQRYRYVQKEGWLPNRENDLDRYDIGEEGARTRYILRSNKGDPQKLVAGARLTQLTSVEESLTLTMMNGDPEAQLTARENKSFRSVVEAVERGEVAIYDFTRLVPDAEYENTEALPDIRKVRNSLTVRNALLDIMGACLAASVSGDRTVAWLYLTTPGFIEFLDGNGIEHIDLAHMQDSASGAKDTLCVTYPQEAMVALRESKPAVYGRILNAAVSLGFREELLQQTK